jgi:hypothetical protein
LYADSTCRLANSTNCVGDFRKLTMLRVEQDR